MTLVPDTKDWTWVLDRPCPECLMEPARTPVTAVSPAIRASVPLFLERLGRPDAASRRQESVWSVLEYCCHVRDVNRVFDRRVRRMLTEADPVFESWDQDATAVRERYDAQDPAVVGPALDASAAAVAEAYDGVPDGAWERPGRRGNGSVFTIASLARYHLHDVVHHLHDLGTDPRQTPVATFAAFTQPFLTATRSSREAAP